MSCPPKPTPTSSPPASESGKSTVEKKEGCKICGTSTGHGAGEPKGQSPDKESISRPTDEKPRCKVASDSEGPSTDKEPISKPTDEKPKCKVASDSESPSPDKEPISKPADEKPRCKVASDSGAGDSGSGAEGQGDDDEESGEGGEGEGSDDAGSSGDDSADAGESEDAELIDPQERLRNECAETRHCKGFAEELETCNERVSGRQKTEETCLQEVHDFRHCVDHCVAQKLFKFLK